jgi:dihydropteroate synthase
VRPPELRGFPDLGRTRVMGIVNVTPDSFSDGGLLPDAASAVRHGRALLDSGADLLDVGGESTRPGAGRVLEREELDRVLPVVEALGAAGAVVSVDTTRARVAAAALDVGALVVNDVSGGVADPAMLPLVADRGCAYVAMHWRGHSDRMQSRAVYEDVVTDVAHELGARRAAALAAGVAADRLLLDPGLGFAKDAGHNWSLLAALPRLAALGPLLVGASRKAFLGALLADASGAPRPARERDAASAALTVLAAQAGAWAVRVHEVRASADAVRVVAQVTAARAELPAAGGAEVTAR